MDKKEPDTKPDKSADGHMPVEDRGETVDLVEPLLIGTESRHRAELTDRALELAENSAALRHRLPDGVLTALARLVRAMNCYYSNLIEGHDTHPVEIERALKNDYSTEPKKRNLQLEARAHIQVQEWIDENGLESAPTTRESLLAIHQRFCSAVPEELLEVEHPDTGQRVRVTPGALRQHDVQVGRHVAVSPGAIPRFLERLETRYTCLGKTDAILASAAAHHRLLWIHPFSDGNGRVARLMSHAMLGNALRTAGIWSISRGLARNVEEYKRLLMACDAPRRNDLDGRGQLSEEALADFTRFFLDTCIDQVQFMEELMQPDRLRDRILTWVSEEIRADALPPQSGKVLEAVLYRGELPRGEATELLSVSERQARRVTAALLQREVLVSDSSRAPLRLAFPARLASRWMPGLFPPRED